MSVLVFFAVWILLISMAYTTQAMICSIGQEPDAANGNKFRWVIPVSDPCECTKIRMGGLNTRTPARPFNVTYHDTPFINDDYKKIWKWLKCPVNECDEDTHTCSGSGNEVCSDKPVGYDCVCQEGYHRPHSGGLCQACHFSTVPHPEPYSYKFILEPQISPFTLNFSVKTGGSALVGLSEDGTDQSVIIETLFGFNPSRSKIVVRRCMPHLCETVGFGGLMAEYTDTTGLTSSTEYHPFWINYAEGVITAGKGGEHESPVEWDAGAHYGRVPNQLHIGISTWENAYGEWDFCK
ncbi:uncharacterized protein [Asterias amurensis]|uniref:uncharacterized protein n=1 Tax=Asterias amurensis TaxID=7602 RepID=UPI003AB52676